MMVYITDNGKETEKVMKVAKLIKFAEMIKDEEGRIKETIPGAFAFAEEPVPEIDADQVLLKILWNRFQRLTQIRFS